ncbi:hypothetical protein BN136_3533 [Cronobacter universalis NCTC 9529]|nr:hypothetical protein BN136_3533 [Cronobacter universalis NCTC 9529]
MRTRHGDFTVNSLKYRFFLNAFHGEIASISLFLFHTSSRLLSTVDVLLFSIAARTEISYLSPR